MVDRRPRPGARGDRARAPLRFLRSVAGHARMLVVEPKCPRPFHGICGAYRPDREERLSRLRCFGSRFERPSLTLAHQLALSDG